MHTVFLRILLDFAIIASILFAPWWVALALAALALIRFGAYEIVFAGLLADILYGTGFIAALTALAAALVVFIVRPRLFALALP